MAPSLSNDPATLSGVRAVQVEALGQSEAFLNFSDRLSKVAPINRPVLLIGERGTGKELAADRIHYLSQRWQSPLVTLNCAALAETLIEAELFGHEKGAFTGADQRRPGRFESANGGTLFLDEIGSIPLQAQAKILRVVEYGIFERVGGTRSVDVDVRIVGATHADLPALVEAGRFKPDLLDRLAFEVLVVPPLRERSGDIDLLSDHFAMKMAVELQRQSLPRFSRAARARLHEYHWPGNIRELKNVVERAVYRTDSDLIDSIEINPFAGSVPTGPQKPQSIARAPDLDVADYPVAENRSLKQALSDLEIRMLKEVLAKTRFNQRQSAKLLGISYDQLRGMVRKHAAQLEIFPPKQTVK